MIEIFTDGDGSCLLNPGIGSYGFIVVNKGSLVHEFCELDISETTNNRIELKAIISGLNYCETETDYVIYSDSKYCVNMFNSWIDKWMSRDWKTKKKLDIKNLDLVKDLNALKQSRPLVKLRWIKGHSENEFNDYIDSLVTSKVSRYYA